MTFTLFCALLVIVADVVIKFAADRGDSILSPSVLIASALYVCSALTWFIAMRHIPLGQAAVAYTMFSMIALCAIGAMVFGEDIRLREATGLACAVAAVVLLVRFV
ncbi:MAG: hypothetical protein LPJ92_12160 [Rhodobacterales bacterium]|nr:hypothetical protein [Rhodobacterales bacterium]MDX5391090.1 hypothetical protein [Rhodobacterales bacterium]MDX5490785.1 hypothetical protein [Rhodobacterales bacterium]